MKKAIAPKKLELSSLTIKSLTYAAGGALPPRSAPGTGQSCTCDVTECDCATSARSACDYTIVPC